MLQKNYYPPVEEIGYQDPFLLFSPFAKQEGSLLFHSAEERENSGRYSFIAVDPFQILTSKNGIITLNGQKTEGNPFDFLEELLSPFSFLAHPDLPPFQGGAAGFFSYDLSQHLETIPRHKIDEMAFPDLVVGFYDVVMAFDHVLKRAWIFSSGYPENNLEKRILRSRIRMAEIKKIIKKLFPLSPIQSISFAKTDIESNFSRGDYVGAVEKVKSAIVAGDIFEANISQRFKVELADDFSALECYRKLCAINPAPFSAYLYFSDMVLISASPERFLKLTGKHVETRPIKGTRPRGKTKEEDDLFMQELIDSEKDRAENSMIVDLLRNDLSRVCCDHSVHVPILCGLETYRGVHHLVSVVTGILREDQHAIDLLRATFPGGSITGAPKIRAMEIIAEIEPTARGPYCGSIGYIGFQGDMDSSITIRTCAIKNNCAVFQAGGAVVIDSDPTAEYEETLTKVRLISVLFQQGKE